MSEFDDLAEALRVGKGLNPEELAEEIITAGWHRHRTITTVEELDALPVDSIVRSTYSGGVWEKFPGGYWCPIGCDDPTASSWLIYWSDGRLTVLFEGGAR